MCRVWLSVMTILLGFLEAFSPSEAYLSFHVAQAIPNLEPVAPEEYTKKIYIFIPWEMFELQLLGASCLPYMWLPNGDFPGS